MYEVSPESKFLMTVKTTEIYIYIFLYYWNVIIMLGWLINTRTFLRWKHINTLYSHRMGKTYFIMSLQCFNVLSIGKHDVFTNGIQILDHKKDNVIMKLKLYTICVIVCYIISKSKFVCTIYTTVVFRVSFCANKFFGKFTGNMGNLLHFFYLY